MIRKARQRHANASNLVKSQSIKDFKVENSPARRIFLTNNIDTKYMNQTRQTDADQSPDFNSPNPLTQWMKKSYSTILSGLEDQKKASCLRKEDPIRR